jgi:transcriptional regulator of acetoin/glycerol metabolism
LLQLSAAALDALVAYDWPGNVRVIERAVALPGSDFLEPGDLPPALLGGYADVLVPSSRSNRESLGAAVARGAPGHTSVDSGARDSVHNRTLILRFRVRLPSTTARGRSRERVR